MKKEKIAKDTYTFYFKRDKFPDFIPGQYIRVTLPHINPDSRGTSRYFTISSSPLEKKILTITTKIVKSSYKKTLLNLKPSAKINVFGPMGWFLLPKDEPFEKVFIAGGIGITPFHSLLQTLVDKKLKKPITLFAFFKTEKDAIFYNELAEIAKKNKNISVVYFFSKASKIIISKYIKDLFKPVYYIVGSERMVSETKKLLINLGVDEEKIQTEDFTGY